MTLEIYSCNAFHAHLALIHENCFRETFMLTLTTYFVLYGNTCMEVPLYVCYETIM